MNSSNTHRQLSRQYKTSIPTKMDSNKNSIMKMERIYIIHHNMEVIQLNFHMEVIAIVDQIKVNLGNNRNDSICG